MNLSHMKLCLRYSSVLFKVVVWNEVVPHFSNRTLEYLRHNFPWDRLISRQTNNPWLSYSQDLNPPDYFLRGYLKDRVCEKKPQAREDIIRKEIKRITQGMLNRIVDNFIVRVLLIQQCSAWSEHSINYWKSIVKHYWF